MFGLLRGLKNGILNSKLPDTFSGQYLSNIYTISEFYCMDCEKILHRTFHASVDEITLSVSITYVQSSIVLNACAWLIRVKKSISPVGYTMHLKDLTLTINSIITI
jgi:hypothetical protein